jgi:tRNA pseudouridine38-40 synthase
MNRFVRSAMYRDRAWWVHRQLDPERMQQASQCLLGKHDFSAFRASGCQASSPLREIHSITVEKRDEWLWVTITANAFLQHMVRNIVGLLAAIGCGDVPVSQTGTVLESRDRRIGGVAAPAHGLTLVAVRYPDEYELPNGALPLGSAMDNVYDVGL